MHTQLKKSMQAETIESYRAGAEVYNGHNLCKEKSIQLLEEIGLPRGLLPLEDIEEFGYNREVGFIWLIQKNQRDHVFQEIRRAVNYSAEVTAFVKRYKVKNIIGVKANDYMIQFSIDKVYFEDPTLEKLTIKTTTGQSRSFLASAFEQEDPFFQTIHTQLKKSMQAENIEYYRAGAEVYNGHNLCKEKSIQLLEEISLPRGLLPLEDIEEFGYNREAGFIWLIQKNQRDHVFQEIRRAVNYSAKVTAFVKRYKVKNIIGVKVNEHMIQFSIDKVYFEDPALEKLTIKTTTGHSRSFLASAFEQEDPFFYQTIHTQLKKSMQAETIEYYRAGAEVYNGHDLCKEKSIQLLEEIGLPRGLLPLEDIEEFGYNREADFIWLIQKNQRDHVFQKIRRAVNYSAEVTAFVKRYKVKNIIGVKVNEHMIQFSIDKVHFKDPMLEELTITATTGHYRSFLASAFELED